MYSVRYTKNNETKLIGFSSTLENMKFVAEQYRKLGYEVEIIEVDYVTLNPAFTA